MFQFPEDPQPEDDEALVQQQQFRADADKLFEVLPAVEDDLRKVGIYVDLADSAPVMVLTPMGPRVAVSIGATLGDVAFRPQVQDPQGDAVDNEFRSIEAAAEIDGFLDARQQWLSKLDQDPTDEA